MGQLYVPAMKKFAAYSEEDAVNISELFSNNCMKLNEDKMGETIVKGSLKENLHCITCE